MQRRTFVGGAAALTTALATAPSALAARKQAATGEPAGPFAWPRITAQTRPWTRWWWLGSAVDEDGLRQHLRAFREAGLGGVEIQPIYGAEGDEGHFRSYLSRSWVDALDTASRLARREGLGVDMTTGSGWPMGGPWVAAEDGAARLLTKEWTLTAGQTLTEPVRTVQPPRPPLTADQGDITPGPPAPDRPAPEPTLTALVARDDGGRTVDLTTLVGADRRLAWTAPAGRWRLVAAFVGRVEKSVERAGPGAKGLVIDYVSERALPKHLAQFDAALGRRAHGVRAMFHDSYELETSDWSDRILDDFRRLRGYDPVPFLPELATDAGDADVRARVRSDFRETFSDLLLERFTHRWAAWSGEHGWITRNQAHGSPGNLLDLYGGVDIPETEGFGTSAFPIPGLRSDPRYEAKKRGRPDPLVMRFAASPAHVQGKQLVSSESCTWLAEHYNVSLSQMKPEIDQLFAAGINHVFFHGSTYSPARASWPGFDFYASTELNPANTLWHDLPELTGYITRCQSVLQHGEHDNDVLVLFPQHDLWHDPKGELTPDYTVHGEEWVEGHPTGFGRVVGGLVERGWQLDYVSDRQLRGFGVRDGVLTNDRSTYATLVVPGARRLPIETMERLHSLARAGATVVFERRWPEDVAGWHELEARRARFRALVSDLRRHPRAGRRGEFRVGKGRVILTDGSQTALDRALTAGGARREPLADRGLRVLRRTHAGGHHLFVVNLGATAVSGWTALSSDARSVVALDPLHDRRGVLEHRRRDGRSEVRLDLAAGESVILRTYARRAVAGPRLPPLSRDRSAVALTGTWAVSHVAGGPRRPAARRMRRLRSWTRLGGAWTALAGTARYTLEFEAPVAPGTGRWALDLGDVRESARVRLNGHDVGTAWALPFRLPLEDGALRPGTNRLEVEVTNLAANRIRDLSRRRGNRWIRYFFVSIAYGDFDAAKWKPVPSGLLGPVRLVRLED